MKRLLVVNADDFGLCPEISTGIIKAHRDGIVTATSISACGKFLKEGVALLKDSGLDAGIHLTLVGGEKPLLGPIAGLTDEEGNFRNDYRLVLPNLILGRFDKRSLEKELFGQVSLLKDSGINPTHLDSHQHLHLMPAIREIAIRLSKHFKIK